MCVTGAIKVIHLFMSFPHFKRRPKFKLSTSLEETQRARPTPWWVAVVP